MTIFNLGSINADVFYTLPHLVGPGETLAASSVYEGLGGKGANMSVAAAQAGADVRHIGAVGLDGGWAIDRLAGFGVETQHIQLVAEKTGHAIIMVDDAGENAIVLYPGANASIPERAISTALETGSVADTLLLQNETNAQQFAAMAAKELGLKVAYAAAPFNAESVNAVLPYIDILVLNEVEADQLATATGQTPAQLPVSDIIVTLGAQGCRWYANSAGTETEFSAIPVEPVDTTGAGDTFTGYLLAALDSAVEMPEAIDLAMKAAAIMVTRRGTADVIPTLDDVLAF